MTMITTKNCVEHSFYAAMVINKNFAMKSGILWLYNSQHIKKLWLLFSYEHPLCCSQEYEKIFALNDLWAIIFDLPLRKSFSNQISRWVNIVEFLKFKNNTRVIVQSCSSTCRKIFRSPLQGYSLENFSNEIYIKVCSRKFIEANFLMKRL